MITLILLHALAGTCRVCIWGLQSERAVVPTSASMNTVECVMHHHSFALLAVAAAAACSPLLCKYYMSSSIQYVSHSHSLCVAVMGQSWLSVVCHSLQTLQDLWDLSRYLNLYMHTSKPNVHASRLLWSWCACFYASWFAIQVPLMRTVVCSCK